MEAAAGRACLEDCNLAKMYEMLIVRIYIGNEGNWNGSSRVLKGTSHFAAVFIGVTFAKISPTQP